MAAIKEEHHKKWLASGTVAVLFMLILLNGIGVVDSSENWTVYQDATRNITVRYENEENEMTVSFPAEFLPGGISEVSIKHRPGVYENEENENGTYYDNMLFFVMDQAYGRLGPDVGHSRLTGIGVGWGGDIRSQITVDTSSPVVVIKADTINRQLYFAVAGPTGTSGDITLDVTKDLISSAENVRGYLDNQEIILTISESGDEYVIRAEYTHSVHTLTIDLGPMPISPWYAQPLNLTIIATAIVSAAVAAYWLRFRR